MSSAWQWKSEADNADLFTKDGEGAYEGKIAWFLRPRSVITIWRAVQNYSPVGDLGRRQGSISFQIGKSTHSRIIVGGGFFVCVSDEKEEMTHPTGYIRHTQRWQYNGTNAKRVSDWFDPDEDDSSSGSGEGSGAD